MIAVTRRYGGQTEALDNPIKEAVVSVQDAVVQALDQDHNQRHHQRLPRQPLYGNLTAALYRFEASRLGPEYLKGIAKFDEFIGQALDPVGARFAATRSRQPGPRQFHQECFQPPNEEKLLHLEQQKKLRNFRGVPRLEFLHGEHELFYGPQPDNKNYTMITEDHKWSWRTAAVFSAQYAGRQAEFRNAIQSELNIPGVEGGFFGGLVSGTFWYPPNAIREWHTNAWDMAEVDPTTGEPEYPWRMYYVRHKAATPDGGLDTSRTVQDNPDYFKDKSAMHLVDGPGIPPERLQEFGAYRLSTQYQQHEVQAEEDDYGPSVWRIPDQNGYVSIFRLQKEKPYRWHCIVTDDSVHRYSMGMSLSDAGVEAMLKHAGVEL